MKTIAQYLLRTTLLAGLCVASVNPCRAADPGTAGDGDFTIGPDYTNAPELTVKEGVPRGTIHEFVMDSADSPAYPGLKGPYKRAVYVYVPSQYVAGTAAPFIVAQDGRGYTNALSRTLDTMIHEHRLPVMIAIMINSGGGDGKGSERGLEYDTVSGKYAEFIEAEVLPRVAKECNVKFTSDPEGRAAMGGSSGGAAAFTMGWFHPELYRRILTYSGTYVNQQSPVNPASPHGAWEYHETLIPNSPKKPIRIWMEVGEKDLHFDDPEQSFHNWPMANKRMAVALKAKGYDYHLSFALGAMHCDGRVIAQTLPESLEWTWKGYPR